MLFATRESHSELFKILKLRRYHALIPDAWFMRAESLFNVATEIEKLGVVESYGSRSLHESSLAIDTELTDDKRIEAEARQNVGHSLVDL